MPKPPRLVQQKVSIGKEGQKEAVSREVEAGPGLWKVLRPRLPTLVIVSAAPLADLVLWSILVPPVPAVLSMPIAHAAVQAEPPGPPPPPDDIPSDEYLTSALQDLWSGQDEDLMQVRVGRGRVEIQERLLTGLPSRPRSVRILYSPARNHSGLYTLQVTDVKGREGTIGLRLIRHAGEKPGWEAESVVVLSPAR